MKKMKKLLTMGLAMSLALGLTACSSDSSTTATGEDVIKVGVLQYVEINALDLARDGFIQALADNGYVDGENLELDLQNAQADQSNLLTMSQRMVNNESDVILAIATPAAQSVASETTEIPILFTAVTDAIAANLVDSNEVPGGNITGTSDMNPVAEQIDLLKELVPTAQTVGLIYSSSEDNSILQAGIAIEAIEALGMDYVVTTVTSANEVQQATQSLVNKCDVIYVPTDNVVSSAMPIVSEIATDAGILTICGESGMIPDGGFAALSINYEKLGYQTGEMAVRILNGEDPATMPVESMTEFDFVINQEIAIELGIDIPEKYLDSMI